MSRVSSHASSSREAHTGHMMGPHGHASSWPGFAGFQPTPGGSSAHPAHRCDAGDWWQSSMPPASQQQDPRTSSIASDVLGLVADAKTPADKAALISAAISILRGGPSQCDARNNGRVAKILGDLTHQITNSTGPSDPAKGQLLDGIAKILKQLVSGPSHQPGANSSILKTLNQLVSQVSEAKGLDQATKNNILDKLSSIILQLADSSSGSPCDRSAGHLSADNHITDRAE